MSFKTPILLITFNRLDTTIQVFEQIKQQKPKYLFISSDGPRQNRADDFAKIEEVRNYILQQIDWDCEIKTLFHEKNQGCGLGVSGAITWFFDNVEQGIILEDDCIPYPDFFGFCEENLNHYKNDDRIWAISGTNLQGGIQRGTGSYYFSNYGGIWGWATWARAWKHYDYNMKTYNQFVKSKSIKNIFKDPRQQKHWIAVLNTAAKVDTWDYQWLYTHWFYNGLCIVPNVNLIKNIGFNADGTHTITEPAWYKSATTGSQTLHKIKHPAKVEVDYAADDFLYENSYKHPSFIKRGGMYVKRILNRLK
jgi:hypothetical protein